ncbi:Hypothetical Protein FCC1311_037172 [Hondaea fermentalgiana]|uniref:Uncharacterized protein n=1 Tax=Hondaea fermentalgiana TaxID=2315210 RepID=A0A2R5GHZ3_9STRA|nr:Hypothetical Protein FCC1311_037172 [Hondaea fermentalgiana]|eukprot:GBG27494.1 Hypothetical Protein FCC1311_037172 [Hondaea fermentalgiana]
MNAWMELCAEKGHGTWNSTSNRCECDEWWSGKTDMLNFDGYACLTYEPVNMAIWCLPLIAITILQVRIVKAFRTQISAFWKMRARQAKRGMKLRWWQHKPLRLVLIAQISPILIFFAVPFKVALHENRVVGYDVHMSVAFFLAAGIQFVGNVMAEEVALGALLQGFAGSNGKEVERIQRRMFRTAYFAIFIYCCLSFPTYFTGAIEGKPYRFPYDSEMRYMLIIRNFGVVSYLLWMALLAKQTTSQTARLLAFHTSTATSEKTREVNEILNHLRGSAKAKMKTAVMAALIYGTFSIKPLWPYQGIPMAFLLFKVASSRAHYICDFMVWSAVLLACVYLQVQIIRAGLVQLAKFSQRRRFQAKRGQTLKLYRQPFVLLGIIAELSPLCMGIVAWKKVTRAEDRTIGYDVLVSVFFAIATVSGFIGNFLAEMVTFEALAKGIKTNSAHEMSIVRRKLSHAAFAGIFVYIATLAGSIVPGCLIDEGEIGDPRESVQRWLLIGRNMGTIAYMLLTMRSAQQAYARAQEFNESLLITSVLAQNESNKALQRFVENLEALSREKVKTGKTALVVYTVFSLPWMWPYQSVAAGLVTVKVFTSRLHFVHQYLGAVKAAKTKAKNANEPHDRDFNRSTVCSQSKVSPSEDQLDDCVQRDEGEHQGQVAHERESKLSSPDVLLSGKVLPSSMLNSQGTLIRALLNENCVQSDADLVKDGAMDVSTKDSKDKLSSASARCSLAGIDSADSNGNDVQGEADTTKSVEPKLSL